MLKISNHTVDWYMNGIQDKLNAKNRHHVVACRFPLGLDFRNWQLICMSDVAGEIELLVTRTLRILFAVQHDRVPAS